MKALVIAGGILVGLLAPLDEASNPVDCGNCFRINIGNPSGCGMTVGITWDPGDGDKNGTCDQTNCSVTSNCKNTGSANVTVANHYLDGGGAMCAHENHSVAANISGCGQCTVTTINVHTGTPCTAANKVCQIQLKQGCHNCSDDNDPCDG